MNELPSGKTRTERACHAFFDPLQYTFLSPDGRWTDSDGRRNYSERRRGDR